MPLPAANATQPTAAPRKDKAHQKRIVPHRKKAPRRASPRKVHQLPTPPAEAGRASQSTSRLVSNSSQQSPRLRFANLTLGTSKRHMQHICTSMGIHVADQDIHPLTHDGIAYEVNVTAAMSKATRSVATRLGLGV